MLADEAVSRAGFAIRHR